MLAHEAHGRLASLGRGCGTPRLAKRGQPTADRESEPLPLRRTPPPGPMSSSDIHGAAVGGGVMVAETSSRGSRFFPEIRICSRSSNPVVVAPRLQAALMSTVQRCDQIIVLQGGAIAEYGSPAELLRRDGAFAGYWRSQFGHEQRPVSELAIVK